MTINFNKDVSFSIGKDHHRAGKPCQDWATSFDTGQLSGVICTDGCSEKGFTDLGARMWGLIAKDTLSTIGFDVSPLDLINELVRKYTSSDFIKQHLSFNDGLSTMNILKYSKELNKFDFLTIGDGVFGYIDSNDILTMWELSFKNNTPFYINYLTQNKSIEDIQQSNLFQFTATKHSYKLTKNLETDALILDELSAPVAQTYTNSMYYTQCVEAADVVMAFCASDGAVSFDKSEWPKFFVQYLNIKAKAGSFIQRKVAAQARKQEQTTHSDDLAIGAFIRV